MNAMSKIVQTGHRITASDLSLQVGLVWDELSHLMSDNPKWRTLCDRQDALEQAILTAPTASMRDALVQICLVTTNISQIEGFVMKRHDQDRVVLETVYTLFSVVAFMARELNLNLEEVAGPHSGSYTNPFLEDASYDS